MRSQALQLLQAWAEPGTEGYCNAQGGNPTDAVRRRAELPALMAERVGDAVSRELPRLLEFFDAE